MPTMPTKAIPPRSASAGRLASVLLAGCVAALTLTACSRAATTAGPIQTRPSPIARIAAGPPTHVAVIVMENQAYGDVIGSPSAPFINHLARQYSLARQMYAITHPSLPNYLALTGGSRFRIGSDCSGCVARGSSIVDQLEKRGLTWKAYIEGLPRPCYTGDDTGDYIKAHDPLVYYAGVRSHPQRCQLIVPLTQLSGDEAKAQLPSFIWITPNACHDMHDCDVAAGDRFLSRVVPPLLHALGPRGLLFLVWDEGPSNDGCCRLASGGQVAAVIAGGQARRGARLAKPVDHYSVLQAIEDVLGLPRLRGAACACTPSLAPL